jgi:hypothetical protein
MVAVHDKSEEDTGFVGTTVTSTLEGDGVAILGVVLGQSAKEEAGD